MPVPQGEGVGVHHHAGGGLPLLGLWGQGCAVPVKAAPPVLHEHQGAGHADDLIKAQVGQVLGAVRLGIEEQVGAAPGQLHLHQVADDLIEQPLPPVAAGDGQTADGIAEAAPSGGQLPVIVKDAAGIVQVPVPADALLLQQVADLGHTVVVVRMDLRQGVGHGGTSKIQSGAAAAAAAPLTLWYHR